MKLSCAALLFDLDGVLIDSTPAVSRVWAAWALEHGFDAAKVVALAHGRPSIDSIRELLPNSDAELENKEVERRELADLEGVIPLPGALKLLSSLPVDRWTIVTSCTRKLAEVRMRAAGLPAPNMMITATEINNGKPHPEPYLKGAELLGIPPEECVVIEDVPAGIQSGKAANMRVIAVTTTAPASTLRKAGADWILTSCAEISVQQEGSKLQITLPLEQASE